MSDERPRGGVAFGAHLRSRLTLKATAFIAQTTNNRSCPPLPHLGRDTPNGAFLSNRTWTSVTHTHTNMHVSLVAPHHHHR